MTHQKYVCKHVHKTAPDKHNIVFLTITRLLQEAREICIRVPTGTHRPFNSRRFLLFVNLWSSTDQAWIAKLVHVPKSFCIRRPSVPVNRKAMPTARTQNRSVWSWAQCSHANKFIVAIAGTKSIRARCTCDIAAFLPHFLCSVQTTASVSRLRADNCQRKASRRSIKMMLLAGYYFDLSYY